MITVTIMTINTRVCISVSLPPSGGAGSGNRAFHFGCGTDPSRCSTILLRSSVVLVGSGLNLATSTIPACKFINEGVAPWWFACK